MMTTIRQEGNELIISVPQEVLKKLNMSIGEAVKIWIKNDTFIISSLELPMPCLVSHTTAEEQELANIAILSTN